MCVICYFVVVVVVVLARHLTLSNNNDLCTRLDSARFERGHGQAGQARSGLVSAGLAWPGLDCLETWRRLQCQQLNNNTKQWGKKRNISQIQIHIEKSINLNVIS